METTLTNSPIVGKTACGQDIKAYATGGFLIGKARIGKSAAFGIRYALSKGLEIKGGRCWSCGAEDGVYQTASQRLGEELARITYTCSKCGARDTDMLD